MGKVPTVRGGVSTPRVIGKKNFRGRVTPRVNNKGEFFRGGVTPRVNYSGEFFQRGGTYPPPRRSERGGSTPNFSFRGGVTPRHPPPCPCMVKINQFKNGRPIAIMQNGIEKWSCSLFANSVACKPTIYRLLCV